jgi:hypothetical protein
VNSTSLLFYIFLTSKFFMNLKKENKIKPLELWYSDPTKEHLGCSSIMYTYIQVNKQSKKKRRMMWNMPQSCAQLNASVYLFTKVTLLFTHSFFWKRNKSEPLSFSLIGRVNIYGLPNFSKQLIWYIPITSHHFGMIGLCNGPII